MLRNIIIDKKYIYIKKRHTNHLCVSIEGAMLC
jgi:hypothetical protein